MTIDMSTTRTDLALESVQAARSGAEAGTISGVRSRERTREGYAVTDIRVEDEDGAQALGKPLEEVTRDYTGQAALGRMVTAQDVAHMALFAASDLARNVTGQELAVDGHTQALS